MLGCAAPPAGPRVGLPGVPPTEELAGRAHQPLTAEPAPPTEPPLADPEELPPIPRVPSLDLPERAADAKTGKQFIDSLAGLGRGAIDQRVLEEVRAGNVPDFQRTLAPVVLESSSGRVAVIHVMNDYLAIGSDDDFIRMPMTSAAAQSLCDDLDMTLPTKRMVDAIYFQADAKLPPSYIDGGPTDDGLADFLFHQETLEARRKKAGFTLGQLLAGHKKDIVLTTRMRERNDRVAIYGWHKKDGTVIQPLSCKHSCRYADYSHGVRLVAEAMTLDGEPRRVTDVLADLEEAEVLSDEGPLTVLAYSTTLP